MSVLLPAMVVGCVLMGMRAKVSVYDAFIRGAKEGLMTLGQMAPCLCAVMTAVALMRETGLMDAISALMEPALSLLCDLRGERNGLFYGFSVFGRGRGQKKPICRLCGTGGICRRRSCCGDDGVKKKETQGNSADA